MLLICGGSAIAMLSGVTASNSSKEVEKKLSFSRRNDRDAVGLMFSVDFIGFSDAASPLRKAVELGTESCDVFKRWRPVLRYDSLGELNRTLSVMRVTFRASVLEDRRKEHGRLPRVGEVGRGVDEE